MTDPVVRRLERMERKEWEKDYRRALPKVTPPTPTPDCTCDWMDIRSFCDPEPLMFHTGYGEDCPDHTKPEEVP